MYDYPYSILRELVFGRITNTFVDMGNYVIEGKKPEKYKKTPNKYRVTIYFKQDPSLPINRGVYSFERTNVKSKEHYTVTLTKNRD